MAFMGTDRGKRDDGSGLTNMLVLSFLLHALIISILLFSPSWPTPKWTFGPVYSVDLVSLPLASVKTGTVSALSREIAGITPAERSVVLKKSVDPVESSLPVKKREPLKKASPVPLSKSLEPVRKSEPAQAPDTSSVAKAETGPAGPVASQGNAEINLKMRVYYSVIWSKIREQWVLPEGILNDEVRVAVIGLKILRNGVIGDIVFEKSSGNTYFDESALKAIRKAGPFPPLPEWLNANVFEVGIRFHSSELR